MSSAVLTARQSAPQSPSTSDEAVLVMHGEDRPGIVSAVSEVLARHGANIVSLDQHTDDPDGGRFFQRTVFTLQDLVVNGAALEADLAELLGSIGMTWTMTQRSVKKRVIILASRSDHCLLDLLWRHRRGEIPMIVPMVISNHLDVADDVRSFGIPFFHVPSVSGADKSESERRIVDLIARNADMVVLARYMQILSPGFLDAVGVPVINIHHSFLPAFIGAGPYKQAKDRGVKLVGATAHYVTAELDEGPIIEQDVIRVSHADSAAELQRKGAYVEREVLSRAVLAHCEDRVIRDGNQTIVF